MSYAGEMDRDISWDLLRSFLAVLRDGSLGKAAQDLGLSQPSLSRHVKQLEEALGTELFERRAQRMVPTPFALRLAEAAQGMQIGADGVARLLEAREEDATRSVRISASRMVSTHLLPALLARLASGSHAPKIEVLAEDELSDLSEREADLAVRLVRPTQQALVARRVGSIYFGFYAARSYLRGRNAPERMADLAAHVVVGFDRSTLMARRARVLGFAVSRGDFGFRSDDRVVHWAAIRAGIGLGMLPTYLAERDPSLVRLLPAQRLTPSGVWLVARREVLARAHVRLAFESLRTGLLETLAAASP